jgi:TetR/AcrR family tetracycline transcriptional repressor
MTTRKPGRPKVGAEILSRESILAAALQLVDAGGVEALSMRRLATALGVDPMAIYRHLADKAAVIDGMVALVFGEFQVPEVDDTELDKSDKACATTESREVWRKKVRAFAAAYRALAQAHPNLIVYLVTNIEASAPVVLVVGEYLADTLRQAGLTPLQVVIGSNLIIDFLNAFVLGASGGLMGKPGEFDAFYALLRSLPPGHYPAMVAVYGALDEETLQAHALDGLELIMDGIATWLA